MSGAWGRGARTRTAEQDPFRVPLVAIGESEGQWRGPLARQIMASNCMLQQAGSRLWPEDRKGRDQSSEEENGCQTAQSPGAKISVEGLQPRPALADRGRQSNRQRNAQRQCAGVNDCGFSRLSLTLSLSTRNAQGAAGVWRPLPPCAGGKPAFIRF